MLVFHVMGRPEVGMDKIKRQVHPRMAAKASGKRRAMDRRQHQAWSAFLLSLPSRRLAARRVPGDARRYSSSWFLGIRPLRIRVSFPSSIRR